MYSSAANPESVESDGLSGMDPVRALRLAVDALAALGPSELMESELADDVIRLRRQMDRCEAVFACWNVVAHRRGTGTVDGYASTSAWLRWQTGLSAGQINQVRRTGEVAELLPAVGAAWRAGQVTSTAVALIAAARVPGHDEKMKGSEAQFLDLATRRDHGSLRIATEHFAKLARAEGTEPEVKDGITLAKVGDRTVVNGELHGDAAETVQHAINEFTLPRSERDGSIPAERRAAALVRICQIALLGGTDAEGAKPAVTYVVKADADGESGLTVGMFTGVMDPRDRDRLLCDCSISRVVLGPGGLPLDVGRASQTWPAAIRRAIVARDQGCQWPGCDVPAPWCDAHHYVHWEHGGSTSVGNGFLLCRRHHTFLHRHTDWNITFDDQRVAVFRPDGRELERDPWARLVRAV